MEALQITDKLADFLREKYENDILKAARHGLGHVAIDFNEMDKYDPVSADQLLENPEEILEKMDEAATNLSGESLSVRVKNLPDRRNIRIRNLRAKHLNRLWAIDGTVKSASEVKPQIYKTVYECPGCGTLIPVKQDATLLKRPEVCECGRRGDFKEVEKKLFDMRWLTVIEPFEITTGEQPGEIGIFLKKDLTTPRMQKMTDPGSRLRFVGVLKEMPKRIKGRLTTRMDTYIDANFITPSEVEYEEIEITEEDKKEIIRLSSDRNIYEKLKASIAPGIYGFDEIKESIALQLFGGMVHRLPDGSRIRGNIHILITGDPGTGKSQILKLVSTIVPRGRYVSGSGVTGAGLTASVRKDEMLGSWLLEAGALILCNKGIISIDEFDKMNKDDQIAMHEGMSLESVSIAKASIVATLPAQTAVLAGANPKLGRFDPIAPIGEQIQIPETLLSIDGDEPIIVEKDGHRSIEKISEFVDAYYSKGEHGHPVKVKNIKVPALNSRNNKIELWPVKYVFRHKNRKPLYKLLLSTGRNVTLTKGHSVYVFENGTIKPKPTDKINVNDYVVIPNVLPSKNDLKRNYYNIAREFLLLPNDMTNGIFLHGISSEKMRKLRIHDKNWLYGRKLPLHYAKNLSEKELLKCTLKYKGGVKSGVSVNIKISKALMRLLGYYIAEGSLTLSGSREHIMSFCFNKKEKDLIADVKNISKKIFNHEAKTIEYKNSVKVNIANRIAFMFFDKILKVGKGAENKRVPGIVLNSPPELQKEFIRAYFLGDYGVTVSRQLAYDILYILLINNVVASYTEMPPKEVIFQDGHKSKSKTAYSISDAPIRMNELRGIKQYNWVPLEPLIDVLKELANKKFKGNFTGSKKSAKYITSERWFEHYFLRKIIKERLRRLKILEKPMTCDEFSMKIYNINKNNKKFRSCREWMRHFLNRLVKKGLIERRKIGDFFHYTLSQHGCIVLKKIENIKNLIGADIGFAKVKQIKILPAVRGYVYDISTPGHENFVAGFGGIVCHNSRFDLKFALRDRPDRTTDELLADHIIQTRTRPAKVEPLININILRKYIAYARTIEKITLSEEASVLLKDFYVDMRNRYAGEDTRTIAITLRQYEALIRLAEASAKVRLDDTVRTEDAERAIRLMKYSLSQLGMDYETGRIDIDKIESGITASKRKKITAIIEIINELGKGKEVAIEDIKAEAQSRGIENIEEVIDRLRREGTIFEPRAGFVRKI